MEHTSDETSTNSDVAETKRPGLNSKPEQTADISSEASEEVAIDNKNTLRVDIEVSRRYNLRMSRSYKKFGQITRLMTIMGGSAAFVSLMSQVAAPTLGLVGTFVLTISTAVDIVVGFEAHSFEHKSNAKQYTNLLRRLMSGESIVEIRQDYYLIEAEEPAPFNLVNNAVNNEVLRYLGYSPTEDSEHFAKISWFKKPVLWIF